MKDMLLEDYKTNFEGWAERAEEAWDEHKNGESISLDEIKKKYGIE